MNKFSLYITLFAIATASLFSSCDSDDIYPTIVLSQQSVYFASKGQTLTFSYTGSDIKSIATGDIPDGWAVNINRSKKTITVVGPTTTEYFDASLTPETVTISATSSTGNSSSDYLELGTTRLTQDLSSEQANSFIASVPNTIYSFSALYKGENEEMISPSSVAILWQSSPTPLSFSRLIDDVVEFHVAADSSDSDGDSDYYDIIEGNAVIAAYDSSDNIIWSWHIWVSDFSADDSAVNINGVTLMGRNLGASANDTTSDATILDSYGLYYQWGRKDPFIGPYYAKVYSGTDATMLNEYDQATYITYEESTSSVGKLSYTIANPLTFILGVEDSSYDWIYNTHSSTLWDDTKTINDPCPKGWRVPSASAYEGLMTPALTSEELSAISEDYGWYLHDAQGNSDLFMGLGRRGYLVGAIQNLNLNENRPEPWAGYYWSASSASDALSTAMLFTFDEADISGNDLKVSTYYRANGMQLRCQKVE